MLYHASTYAPYYFKYLEFFTNYSSLTVGMRVYYSPRRTFRALFRIVPRNIGFDYLPLKCFDQGVLTVVLWLPERRRGVGTAREEGLEEKRKALVFISTLTGVGML